MILRSDLLIKFFTFILSMKQYGDIKALTFYPFIITSKNEYLDKRTINHERIHLRQQRELLIIPFYIWYLIALYRVGYHNISFEREAYQNDHDFDYISNRKPFAFLKY